MEILSHPLYLAPVPLYAKLYSGTGLIIDGDTPFVKQTFRNRTSIASENGTLSLNIPVVHDGGRTAMRNVRISEHGNWRRQHWNALVSAYRNSPFFDYYADDFAHFYEERDGFLMDFNLRLHAVVCELLGLEQETVIAEKEALKTEENNIEDLRHAAEPKNLGNIAHFTPEPYYQVFATRNGFIPCTSIIDLLFNMGPEALITLRDCYR
jgi:hypothetical protein